MSRLRPRGDVVSDSGVAREPGPWRTKGDLRNHAGIFAARAPALQAKVERRIAQDARAAAARKADAERWIKSLRIGAALKARR